MVRKSQHGIPDLTEEQKEKIKEIRVRHLEELLPLKSMLRVNREEYKSLMIGDDVDMLKVYSNIAEGGDIMIQVRKLQANQHREIRQVLTKEQRIHYDMKMFNNHDGQPGPDRKG